MLIGYAIMSNYTASEPYIIYCLQRANELRL